MKNWGIGLSVAALALALPSVARAADPGVQVIGQMRRMFMAHDIGANVDLAKVNQESHVYALGPLAGLKGEITVLDGQVFVSRLNGKGAEVMLKSDARSVFLVYAAVPSWRSLTVLTNAVNERDLATLLEHKLPPGTRAAFLVRGKASSAKFHIQNYQGEAKDLTHEAHDKAKVFFDLADTGVELVGFFTNREEDGGFFVHPGQTTHIHVISNDRKSMGHLESITLAPGAEVFLEGERR
jgi:acetolactate decarboxylase